jgi:O-antigen ligase
VVGTLALSVMPQQFWDRMHTITAPSEERDQSARGRLHFWDVAVNMGAANPFLGVGFDGFQASYNSYDTSKGEFGDDRAVHSTWFGVLAETGYVGLAMFAGLLLLTLWNLFRIRRRQRPDEAVTRAAMYSRALSTSLLAFCAGGTFVNLQYNEMFWHFAALGIALQFITASATAAEPVSADQAVAQPHYKLPSDVPITQVSSRITNS